MQVAEPSVAQTTTFQYDADGRATQTTDANGTTSTSYDAVGRVVGVLHPVQPMGTGGVEPPLEDGALDDQRSGEHSFLLPALGRADVDHQGAGGQLGIQLLRCHPRRDAGPGGRQGAVYGNQGAGG